MTPKFSSLHQKRHCPSVIKLRYHPHIMLSFLTDRLFSGKTSASAQEAASALVESAVNAIADGISAARHSTDDLEESTIFRTLGWVTAGLGAVALGLFVGRELRQRYKFNRRTPYDFYAHSADEHELEFGVGV